jgi:hypothetical protein
LAGKRKSNRWTAQELDELLCFRWQIVVASCRYGSAW